MKNNKGNVSILCINILVLASFILLFVNSLYLETYYYYQHLNKPYNIFLIENAIIKNVYQDHLNVNYTSQLMSYHSHYKIINGNYEYLITLSIHNDIYHYELIYDKLCNQVIEFNISNLTNKT
ncbi:MAG: hypothetical protein LBT75_03375 [Bacilli bacterium]|jgi:hypothetical protein|nr:hypothetical protein [Bacilli bacterium]